MKRHRPLWVATATATATAVAIIGLSVSAMAAPAAPPVKGPSNYRGTSALTGAASPVAAARTPAVKMVTHHYSLAASAFAPDGLHSAAEDYFNSWDPSTLNNQDSGRCFNAGLSLPANATLKSVTAYYTAGSSAMYFEINRQDLVNHTTSDLVSFDSSVASTPAYTATKKSVPSVYAAVDEAVYAYSAGVCPNGTTTFTGLTIAYTQPAS